MISLKFLSLLKLKFGGNLSVWKRDGKPPMFAFGHDECIFVSLFLPAKHVKDQKENVQSFQRKRGMV
jgi:hypothetical protein